MVDGQVDTPALRKAKDIYKNRSHRVKELKLQGKKIAGYFCCQVPLEILTALDLVPYRILGDPIEPPTKGDLYVDTTSCGFVRSCLDLAGKGHYDFLDGLVSCKSCWGIEYIFDLWRYYFGPVEGCVYNIDVPRKVSSWGRDFFKEELADLQKHLQDACGREITEAMLRQSIALHNQNRLLVRKLYDLRKESPPLVTGSEIMEIMVATMSIPPEEAHDLLRDVTSELKNRKPEREGTSKRILIWGGIIDAVPLIGLIEACGADVVMDDTCVGSRFYWPDVDNNGDILEALADRYLDKILCPRTFRNNPGKNHADDLKNRFSYLTEYVRDYKVDGVILQIAKYCDTHGWEVPDVKNILEGLGVPVLFIEHDYNLAALEPLRTRVEAFLETIGG
jgi:bzd-type benzoyl-CoA reductase N subunit